MGKERLSNFELLRIFSMFCIVLMHTSVAVFANGGSQFNVYLCVAVNSICNIGVACFILISGYFGIKFIPEKLMALELKIIFFSVLSMLLIAAVTKNIGIKTVVFSFFPTVTRKYWFFSCYIVLSLLSPFLNKACEQLTKRSFQQLLLTLLIVFSLCPTLFRRELMQDSGKGLANMIMIYLIGRYLKLHGEKIKKWSTKRLASAATLTLMTEFGLNCVETHVRGGGASVAVPFARDCSIFIICFAVLVFLIFRRLEFFSATINLVAESVFAIYLLNGASAVLYSSVFMDVGQYTQDRFYYCYVLLEVLFVMAVGFFVDRICKTALNGAEKTISKKVCLYARALWNWGMKKL